MQFKDKARQKGREKLLAEKAKRKAEEPAKEAAKRNPEPEKPEKRLTAVKRRLLEQRQDESELADDYRLLKRLRRGKMTNVRRLRFLTLVLQQPIKQACAERGWVPHIQCTVESTFAACMSVWRGAVTAYSLLG